MIFVDSDVPMYLVGKPHRNRDLLAEFVRTHPERLYVTSAEVYQEIIHRYVAIDRREAIADAFRVLDGLVETIFSVDEANVRSAHEICERQHRLSARDCLHLAVMQNHAVEAILSCDTGFDVWPAVTRLPRG